MEATDIIMQWDNDPKHKSRRWFEDHEYIVIVYPQEITQFGMKFDSQCGQNQEEKA